jgi:hypothetical protein
MHKLFLVTAVLIASFSFLGQSRIAFADCSNPLTNQEAISCGANDAAGKSGNAEPQNINNTITRLINILSAAVGIVAVVMIIIGGLRYITSGGAAEKVTGAKNILLYAVIGLVIVALAQVIVHFVIQKAK